MQLCVGSVFLYLGLFGVVTAALIAFLLIGNYSPSHAFKGKLVEQLYAQNEAQQNAIAETIRTTEENLDALTLRLGLMHARAIRLEALGKRLTRMSGLDKDEFRFDRAPALGGPLKPSELETQSVPDFLSSLESLAEKLNNVEPKLRALENALLQGQIDSEVVPSGWPITKGWISSPYGHRRDPLTGKRAFHDGIDFAAKLGTEVVAVASGIVVWSGERSGYGLMVELNHGNEFSTRYAHNSQILVNVGDTVRKGDPIAEVGDTGRSTGPHVHLEVLRNNRSINPSRFVNRKS